MQFSINAIVDFCRFAPCYSENDGSNSMLSKSANILGSLALIAGAFKPLLASEPPRHFRMITTTTDLPMSTHIGRVRAGLLCLPHKSMRLVDLIGSKSRLAELSYFAFAATGRRTPVGSQLAVADISIQLLSVDAKLCSKAWGVFGRGQSKQLSGDVSFRYRWKIEGSPLQISDEVITITIGSNDAETADAITRHSLDKLFEKISSSL
jgi:hypothetical protein